ncbi:hypothetical protein [Desertivirga arenae]|uniref:hypothetical protein n=1 Tax=Desertivirga arenae TaxID=2810309 RepID=UPI001A96256E|nr:hypothetical protein [Pedobacter sp. SYSU D00823]
MINLRNLLLSLIVPLLISGSCTDQTNQDAGKLSSIFKDTRNGSNGTVSDDNNNSESAKGSWLLVPGISAGSTSINENASEVLKKLGKPDGGDAAMGKAVIFWIGGIPGKKHTTSIYTVRQPIDSPDAKVKEIRVTSPQFKTKEGNGVGGTRLGIEKEFKLKRNTFFNPALVYDTTEGIAFEFSKDTGYCTAVVIYEKGKRLPEAYLSLREANQ